MQLFFVSKNSFAVRLEKNDPCFFFENANNLREAGRSGHVKFIKGGVVLKEGGVDIGDN